MNVFPRTASVPATQDVALRPVALVEEDLPAPKTLAPAAMAASSVVPTDKYPNLNVVPPPHATKLLTPEEKARVVAELEGLARAQGVTLAKQRAAVRASCDDLSAAELKKRMLQGQC